MVFQSHRWLVFFAAFIAYLSWAGDIGVWFIDMEQFYDILVHALHEDEPNYQYTSRPEDDFDTLGFGQVFNLSPSSLSRYPLQSLPSWICPAISTLYRYVVHGSSVPFGTFVSFYLLAWLMHSLQRSVRRLNAGVLTPCSISRYGPRHWSQALTA